MSRSWRRAGGVPPGAGSAWLLVSVFCCPPLGPAHRLRPWGQGEGRRGARLPCPQGLLEVGCRPRLLAPGASPRGTGKPSLAPGVLLSVEMAYGEPPSG